MRYLLCAALVACNIPLAHAGRPLTTDDAGVLDPGTFELETFGHRDTERNTPRTDGWHVQPSIGIGLHTQIGFGYGDQRSDGEHTRAMELYGKTYLKELTDDSFGIAVSYGAGQSKLPDDKYRYDTAHVTGIVTVPVERWLLHGNLGWTRSRLDGVTATAWAVAAERPNAFGPVDVAFEFWGGDHTSAWAQVDLRWNLISDRLSLDASYAQQASASNARQITLGLKLTY